MIITVYRVNTTDNYSIKILLILIITVYRVNTTVNDTMKSYY